MKRIRFASAFVLASVAVAGLCAVDWHSQANELSAPQDTAAVVRQTAGKQKPEKSLLAQFMRAKLLASSQVLEGLCTEDFELIAKGARSLKKVSSAERWRVSNDIMFRQHSAEYRTSIDSLVKAAEKKQIDSAALAWTKTTFSCIECHQRVRATLIAEIPQQDSFTRAPQK